MKQRRSLKLVSKCGSIDQSDLPEGLRIRSLHIGPVIGEVPEMVARFLASRSAVTSLDPQGYLRKEQVFDDCITCRRDAKDVVYFARAY